MSIQKIYIQRRIGTDILINRPYMHESRAKSATRSFGVELLELEVDLSKVRVVKRLERPQRVVNSAPVKVPEVQLVEYKSEPCRRRCEPGQVCPCYPENQFRRAVDTEGGGA